MTAIYRIKPDSAFLDYFELHVSGTRRAMNRHVEDWSKRRGVHVEHKAATQGLVQPTSIRMHPAVDDDEWRSRCFARMFLNEEDLSEQVAVHECLHVAMAHERHVHHFRMDYGNEIDEHEERLCHYHGKVVEAVMDLLREEGHRR